MTWEEFANLDIAVRKGSEHVVEFAVESGLVVKTTIPPAFGLTPFLNRIASYSADPASPTTYREAIEFRSATPLEYLDRWIANNEVFRDDVRVVSVIRWECGAVSLGITQPQYSGIPAEDRDIIRYFEAAGWIRLNDPTGHIIFFHYAYRLMAIDAAGRNCFIDSEGIQPFDVILCAPDEEIEEFLKIY